MFKAQKFYFAFFSLKCNAYARVFLFNTLAGELKMLTTLHSGGFRGGDGGDASPPPA